MLATKYSMNLQEVQIQYDVHCDWHGKPPIYRLYVNDEMFTERTFIWQDKYLSETIPIVAEPGNYIITYELHGAGQLTATNPQILNGPAEFVNQTTLRIHHVDA